MYSEKIAHATRARAVYNQLRELYQGYPEKGIPPQKAGVTKIATAITPTSLVMERDLQNTVSRYDFDPKGFGVARPKPSERYLLQNDLFCMTDLQIYLKREQITPDRRGAALIHTYPNVRTFLNQSEDLEAIFNGFTTIMIGVNRAFKDIHNRVFRHVAAEPDLRIIAPVPDPALALDVNTSDYAQTLEQYSPLDGVHPVEPLVFFEGTEENRIIVEAAHFPTNVFESQDPAYVNVLGVRAIGFLIEGVYKPNAAR